MSVDVTSECHYNVRFCHIIKWDDFDGYGFNLHAEKGRPGQYVGKIDEGSPAEAAGLKEGDRIVEVNGVNISNENHKQVVQRIKMEPNETKLLVVDPATDNYMKSKNIVVKSSLPNIIYMKTPESRQQKNCVSNGGKPEDHPCHPDAGQTLNGDTEKRNDCSNLRLCHIIKWDDYEGYGFNLHAEKGRQGQYIGKVDKGSPAEAAGLKEGDRIIEVNGVNIGNENHKQVVQRIRTHEKETKLLVADTEADVFYRSKSIVTPSKNSSGAANIIYLKTPDTRQRTSIAVPNGERGGGSSNDGSSISDDTQSQHSSNSTAAAFLEHEVTEGTSCKVSSSAATTPCTDHKTNPLSCSLEPNADITITSKHQRRTADEGTDEFQKEDSVDTSKTSSSISASASEDGTKLYLNMTAKELRARLASRKKYDPKKDSLDIKKKYEIVQKL